MSLRLALTADLHWGSHERGDEATRQMTRFLAAAPPDAFIVAGDVGAGEHFGECLAHFESLPGRKMLVPGNHDIWVVDDDSRGDSLAVYREHLPDLCARHGFHYLDSGPVIFSEAELAIVGSINWYDYSWSIDKLREKLPDWERRLRTKVFSRGRHNDARFVRWALDDAGFTQDVVTTLDRHLHQVVTKVRQVIVVTHHPAFHGLSFPRVGDIGVDGLLWDAFAGNRQLESVLSRHIGHIPFAFCGHTHRARESCFQTIRGHNIGGDYHFKRLLIYDWPARTIETRTFGDPNRRR